MTSIKQILRSIGYQAFSGRNYNFSEIIGHEDIKMILELMDNPPEPNEALKRAFERRQQLLKDEP